MFFQIKPKKEWDERKDDPTEYDHLSETIFVRGDYDINKDVHEKIHAYLDSIHFEDNYNPPLVEYPFNEVERFAYTWQFVYLLETRRIKSVADIKEIMPWKFVRFGEDWAKKYYKNAQVKSSPSSLFHGGGRFESYAELELEKAFREIVDEAKQKCQPAPTFSKRTNNIKKSLPRKADTNIQGCIIAVIIIAIIIVIAIIYSLVIC